MTRKIAINELQNNKQDYTYIISNDAIDMAIKALEQEPILSILDMIRTEVKSKIVKRPWLDFEDMKRDRNDAFLEVLDIIDRYKAETIDKGE